MRAVCLPGRGQQPGWNYHANDIVGRGPDLPASHPSPKPNHRRHRAQCPVHSNLSGSLFRYRSPSPPGILLPPVTLCCFALLTAQQLQTSLLRRPLLALRCLKHTLLDAVSECLAALQAALDAVFVQLSNSPPLRYLFYVHAIPEMTVLLPSRRTKTLLCNPDSVLRRAYLYS